jgi:hypothetical protein
VPLSDLSAWRAKGAFVATLTVDRNATAIDGVVFGSITAAVEQARRDRLDATPGRGTCRITIDVAAGRYLGSTTEPVVGNVTERWPITLDVPDITVRGAYRIDLDAGGRPTGPAPEAAAGSVLDATPALRIVGASTQTGLPEEFFLVDATDSSGGHGAVIEGFVMRSGHAAGDITVGGKGVLAMRARNVVVRGNSFEGNFSERVDLRAGSGTVERNFSSGPGDTCDICIAGPGQFTVRANTLVQGGIPGVLIVPTTVLPVPASVTQFVLPPAAVVTVEVENNAVSGHQRVPVGTAFRVATVGINAPNVLGTSIISFTRNRATGNRFGLIVEAGFPVAGSALRGDVVVTTAGNEFTANCQNDLLVTLTRHTTGLGLANAPYLRNSTFALNLGSDLSWTSAWYAHLAGQGNTLSVNGTPVAPDRRNAYDAQRVCS